MPPTRHHFDNQLEELAEKILAMGTATEEMVRDAAAALTQQNTGLAASIGVRDAEVNRMEQEIEARCLLLLSLQQPVVASDLRLISTALKIITDIERIGDHAVSISKVALQMTREMPYKPLVDIPRMAEMARAMLHDALEAFVQRNAARAETVCASDDEVDALYAQMGRDLQKAMLEDPTAVLQASYLQFVTHYLERICDHCTNIAERVTFLATGRSNRQR